MRRKLLNFATALSLVSLVASATLWFRSYWVVDALSHKQLNQLGGRDVSLASFKGDFLIMSFGQDDPWPGIRGWKWNCGPADDEETRSPVLEFAGFGYTHWGDRTLRYFMFVIPQWSLVAISLFVPVARGLNTLRLVRPRVPRPVEMTAYLFKQAPGGELRKMLEINPNQSS